MTFYKPGTTATSVSAATTGSPYAQYVTAGMVAANGQAATAQVWLIDVHLGVFEINFLHFGYTLTLNKTICT